MDVIRIFSTSLVLSLCGCSSGVWMCQEHEVYASQEIPLSAVPWISAQQQHKEAQHILPSYLRLKQQQERDKSSLEAQLQSTYYE